MRDSVVKDAKNSLGMLKHQKGGRGRGDAGH